MRNWCSQIFLVEHNVSLSASDHAAKLFKNMFPDSKIANSYSCARTKTTALVQHMAANISSSVANSAQTVFSLSTDGSNDNSDKFYPIVLRHIEAETGTIKVSLLSVPTVKEPSATGENIFRTLTTELQNHNLQWQNCLALGGDNAPVMSGTKKGLLGCVRQVNPNIYFAGCPCHLIVLGGKNAVKCLPYFFEDILTDIYYYLKHSAKRQAELKLFQELYTNNDLKVLKHVPTRWLSLGNAINRLLVLWRPLRDYFLTECDNLKATEKDKSGASRPRRVADFLTSHQARTYCYFLQYVLEIFDRANMALQHEKPLVHKSLAIQCDLYRRLLLKFLKPSALTGKVLTDVNMSVSYIQKLDSDLLIGEKARKFMSDKKFPEEKIKKICSNCRSFYQAAAKYLLTKLPLKSDLLKHAQVFDLSKLSGENFASVKYFIDQFPAIKPDCSLDQLQEQFSDLQVDCIPGDILQLERADEQWGKIRLINDAAGHSKYDHLVQVALKVLLIPHSNACCERVFSSVRKIRTDFRGSMQESTLNAVCTVKMSGVKCYDTSYTREETKSAKGATSISLTN